MDISSPESSLEQSGIYFLKHVSENIVKFGSSKNIKKRLISHKKSFGECMVLNKVIFTDQYIKLEDIVKQYANANFTDTKNHNHTEIINFKTEQELHDIYNKKDCISTRISKNIQLK
jgi:hypothetical protein